VNAASLHLEQFCMASQIDHVPAMAPPHAGALKHVYTMFKNKNNATPFTNINISILSASHNQQRNILSSEFFKRLRLGLKMF